MSKDGAAGGNDDRDVWAHVTEKATRIKHDTVPVKMTPARANLRISVDTLLAEHAPHLDGSCFGLEHLQQRKQKKRIVPEGHIDLHGFTQVDAANALRRFLYVSQLHSKSWVKIITGKSGVLKQTVPILLQQFSEFVSGYAEAPRDDGGAGALYVRIRKTKNLS
ncbi:MAG: Smr/MutS family protein [Holosporales bacterium]|jgi:DNA-nicking Smr family endonuclease|nr:Smr/MutS family protein [Holosporales bacterium]